MASTSFVSWAFLGYLLVGSTFAAPNLISPPTGICTEPVFEQSNFSHLTANNLGGQGPWDHPEEKIAFKNVFQGVDVSCELIQEMGMSQNIYDPTDTSRNGFRTKKQIATQLGQITLRSSNLINVKCTFSEELDDFYFTIYDMDQGKRLQKEELSVCQISAELVDVGENMNETVSNECTIITSTENGRYTRNPRSPTILSERQSAVSAEFRVRHRNYIQFSYKVYSEGSIAACPRRNLNCQRNFFYSFRKATGSSVADVSQADCNGVYKLLPNTIPVREGKVFPEMIEVPQKFFMTFSVDIPTSPDPDNVLSIFRIGDTLSTRTTEVALRRNTTRLRIIFSSVSGNDLRLRTSVDLTPGLHVVKIERFNSFWCLLVDDELSDTEIRDMEIIPGAKPLQISRPSVESINTSISHFTIGPLTDLPKLDCRAQSCVFNNVIVSKKQTFVAVVVPQNMFIDFNMTFPVPDGVARNIFQIGEERTDQNPSFLILPNNRSRVSFQQNGVTRNVVTSPPPLVGETNVRIELNGTVCEIFFNGASVGRRTDIVHIMPEGTKPLWFSSHSVKSINANITSFTIGKL